jgi:hypothetical protein
MAAAPGVDKSLETLATHPLSGGTPGSPASATPEQNLRFLPNSADGQTFVCMPDLAVVGTISNQAPLRAVCDCTCERACESVLFTRE